MEGLVNYSSEDDQDDYPHPKVAVRERGGGTSSGGSRGTLDASGSSLKRSYEHSKNNSCERDASPYRKGRDAGSERFKSGNSSSYNDEDKYKTDRRVEKSRDHREKKEYRESKNSRDNADDNRDYGNGHKHEFKRHDDHKHYRESKRDYKRDSNDFCRDDKRYNRYDDRKATFTSNYKDRFNNSKSSRFDDRKQYDDRRGNDERRSGGGGGNFDDRRREFNARRNYNNDDDNKSDRRNKDDRPIQRSYNEDRSNTYRPRHSNSSAPSQRYSGNNKYTERKDDNSTRRERRRHSRSRTRSRSHSVEKSNEYKSPSQSNSQRTGKDSPTETRPEGQASQVAEKKSLPTARNFEALLTLPLSETALKHPNVVTVPVVSAAAGSNLTTATATVQLPSYYNPNVINPNKYVEQMQKRKLIWGAKKTEDSASKWGHAQFSQDQDGKVASKFMRLMGIKSTTAGESSTSPNESETKSPSSTTPPNNTDVKTREAMFSTMEQQYEVARQVTHTMRGVGLGFGSQSRPY